MNEQELKAIKKQLANIPEGWTIYEGITIIRGLKISGDYLVAEVEFLHGQRSSQAKIIEELRAENQLLRGALEEYAAKENYERVANEPDIYVGGYSQPTWEPSWIELDNGEIARKALAGESK